MEVKKISVNDSKKIVEINKRRAEKINERTTPELFELYCGDIRFIKNGAKNMVFYLGEDGIIELLDSEVESLFILNRYNMSVGDSLKMLVKNIPVFAAIKMEIHCERSYCKTTWIKLADDDSEKGILVEVAIIDIKYR